MENWRMHTHEIWQEDVKISPKPYSRFWLSIDWLLRYAIYHGGWGVIFRECVSLCLNPRTECDSRNPCLLGIITTLLHELTTCIVLALRNLLGITTFICYMLSPCAQKIHYHHDFGTYPVESDASSVRGTSVECREANYKRLLANLCCSCKSRMADERNREGLGDGQTDWRAAGWIGRQGAAEWDEPRV